MASDLRQRRQQKLVPGPEEHKDEKEKMHNRSFIDIQQICWIGAAIAVDVHFDVHNQALSDSANRYPKMNISHTRACTWLCQELSCVATSFDLHCPHHVCSDLLAAAAASALICVLAAIYAYTSTSPNQEQPKEGDAPSATTGIITFCALSTFIWYAYSFLPPPLSLLLPHLTSCPVQHSCGAMAAVWALHAPHNRDHVHGPDHGAHRHLPAHMTINVSLHVLEEAQQQLDVFSPLIYTRPPARHHPSPSAHAAHRGSRTPLQ